MKTKLITLSAISSALCALVLTLGVYFSDFLDLFSLMVAPVFISLPLYYDSKKGAILTAIAGGVIALILSGFNVLNLVFIMYFTFFGIYPIVKYLALTKKFKKVLFTVLSLIWFIAVAVGSFFYYTYVMAVPLDFFGIPEYIIPLIVIVVAAILYFVIDKYVFMSQVLVFKLLKRIIK